MFMGASAAGAQVGADFDCSVAQSQSFREDGGFGTEPYDNLQLGNRFTFSETTGEFVWRVIHISTGPEAVQWGIDYEVVQFGSTVNGIVALVAGQGPASYSIKTLRIRTFAPVTRANRRLYPFMLVDEDVVQTGFCRMV
jgi:hypothetical protein